jgi:hypothetical protein
MDRTLVSVHNKENKTTFHSNARKFSALEHVAPVERGLREGVKQISLFDGHRY